MWKKDMLVARACYESVGLWSGMTEGYHLVKMSIITYQIEFN